MDRSKDYIRGYEDGRMQSEIRSAEYVKKMFLEDGAVHRSQIAVQAMNALIQKGYYASPTFVARQAVEFADALIKELSKTPIQ